ncbi:ribose 5-phosphate isomerase B [Chloroflexota bacterium]
MKRSIILGSDHAGFELKEEIKGFLIELGYQVEDVGTYNSMTSVDYIDYTRQAAERVASGQFPRALLFCGTGLGTCIAANKVPGIRATVCLDTFTAGLSRSHNDANVLVLAGWLVGKRLAREIARVWLDTPFEGGRHSQRLDKIRAMERENHVKRGKLYDISHPLRSGMLIWPGDPEVIIEPIKAIAQGKSSNVSRIQMSTHTGTHIDPPRHYLEGASGVDAIVPESFMGLARVFQLESRIKRIDQHVLQGLDLDGVSRVLFGTANSALLKSGKFTEDYVHLSEDGARHLITQGIKLAGVDYLSIEEFHNKQRPAHHLLLAAEVVIVEGLDLDGVPPGDYELLCLPLRITEGDGAPVRAFLREL